MSSEKDMSDDAEMFLRELLEFQNLDFTLKMMPKNCSELAVLGVLAYYGGRMTSGELSKHLDMKTSRIAALLKSLEKKGQIQRSQSKEDKRITVVNLTDQGHEICMEMHKDIQSKIQKAYDTVGKEEMEHFKNTLRKLCAIKWEDDTCLN
jgi:MarR family transcriptional regulator, organic hydroperoxide resistance regulator